MALQQDILPVTGDIPELPAVEDILKFPDTGSVDNIFAPDSDLGDASTDEPLYWRLLKWVGTSGSSGFSVGSE